MTRRKRRKVARLDRPHLLALVRYLRAAALRQGETSRLDEGKGFYQGAMWNAGAGFAYRHAALQIGSALRRQQSDDWRAESARFTRRHQRRLS